MLEQVVSRTPQFRTHVQKSFVKVDFVVAVREYAQVCVKAIKVHVLLMLFGGILKRFHKLCTPQFAYTDCSARIFSVPSPEKRTRRAVRTCAKFFRGGITCEFVRVITYAWRHRQLHVFPYFFLGDSQKISTPQFTSTDCRDKSFLFALETLLRVTFKALQSVLVQSSFVLVRTCEIVFVIASAWRHRPVHVFPYVCLRESLQISRHVTVYFHRLLWQNLFLFALSETLSQVRFETPKETHAWQGFVQMSFVLAVRASWCWHEATTYHESAFLSGPF